MLRIETSVEAVAIRQVELGDCCAYALAVERDEPLRYAGDDFKHTDAWSTISS
ncbi:MAG TPA: type II toxin-antitoxin system VapC family toxin [Propionibacteriaceae bacterium]|nr:type II toxin-antitoxin system VapC family toxin [Propionibacteriaceae bacterium]